MGAKMFTGALFITGAIGLIAGPVWSQGRVEKQSETPITKEPTQTPPGAAPKGTMKLSQQDIREVHQALEKKGYKPGTNNSLTDDKTQQAIRAFQKDHNLPVTGTIDERTAQELGVQLHNASSSGMKNDSSTKGNMKENSSRAK